MNRAATPQDQFGHRLAQRLTAGTLELPHDIGERLRVARQQAVAHRKLAVRLQTATAVVSSGGTAALGGGWWRRIASAAPLVALVVGLVAINMVREDERARELAEVDTALLTDELPPAAFTDPGFAQFLKSEDTTSPGNNR